MRAASMVALHVPVPSSHVAVSASSTRKRTGPTVTDRRAGPACTTVAGVCLSPKRVRTS